MPECAMTKKILGTKFATQKRGVGTGSATDTGTAEKMTKTDKLEQRIRELEERNNDLLAMIENSYDAMAIADGESRLLLLNPAFERVMGIKNAEIIGRKIEELVRKGISDTGATLKVLETGKAQTVLINTIAGRQVLSTGIPVFDKHGRISKVYCNLRDITELNHLKEKYKQSQKLVSKYLLELHEARRMQKMPSTFVAHSERMKQVIETAYRVARIDTTVLILGESGVGKDLVARLIHEASPRMETGTFVKINCGAIPPDLLESELFGHEAGAFTGARKEGKAGYFEIADKGTIFLDEIGDLPLRLQVKLLSVIQDQEVTRVGGTKPKKVDARIIAATNRDVEKMVKTGTFREDLYYRLNVVPFYIPALRERREEIPFLIKHYLNEFNSRYSLKVKLTQEVVERLTAYRWPGNVRELANLVEQLVVLANEELVTVDHLPKRFSIPERNDLAETQELRPLDESVREFEMKLIRSALDQSKSNEEAAHKLGISLSTLARRLRQFKTDSHS